MHPEETAWTEEGCCSHAAILQPQIELCYVTLNGSHKWPLTRGVFFQAKATERRRCLVGPDELQTRTRPQHTGS